MGVTANSCSTLDADNVSERSLPRPCAVSPLGGPCAACVGKTQLELQLVEAKKQLDEAHRAFTAVFKQYQESVTQMNRLHNPTVLRVPQEVASSIFLFSLPHLSTDKPLDSASITRHNRALFALGAVCSEWRRIARSTPQLWTTVAVYLNNKSRSSLVSKLLSRSGSLPLTIHVAAAETCRRPSMLVVAIALKDHSKRWQVLNIQAPTRYLPLFDNISKIPRSFKVLKLVGSGITESESKVQLGKLKPTSVVLEHIPKGLVSVDWGIVLRVDIAKMRLDEFYELLRGAPFLERCRTSCFKYPGYEMVFPARVRVHRSLRELDFQADLSMDHLNGFFAILSFPALTDLKIAFQQFPSDGLISLFGRFHNLERFHIYETDFDDNEFIRALQATPAVQTLIIQPLTNYSPEAIFDALTNLATDEQTGALGPTLLPNLQQLHYIAYDAKVVPWGLIPRFFSQNSGSPPTNGGRRLTSLHIHLEDGYHDQALLIDATMIPSLFAIKAAGADLRITWNVRDGVKDLLDPLQLVHKREDYFK